MRTLTIQEQNSIEQFFKLKQKSLLKAMTNYLQSKYKKVIATNDYVMAIGDIPVALVAHLDTVFKKQPQRIFYDNQKNVMWSPEGLGADDRAGVFAVVQIIRAGYRPTIIFTTDEEKGGVGAYNLTVAYKKAPTDLKYIIQLDRSGGNDCVFYDCDNKKLEEYVESFGFVTDWGSFSDISVICPAWKIAGVNLSIGYYDEHSISETLYVGELFNTIKRVKLMLDDIENAEHYEYISAPKRFQWFRDYPTDYDVYPWDPSYGISEEEWYELMEPQIRCLMCDKYDYRHNMVPVMNKMGQSITVCLDCISKIADVKYCTECGEAFIDKKNSVCFKCREVINNRDTERDKRKI